MSESALKRGQWILMAVLLLAVVALTQDRMFLPGPQRAEALENPIESRMEMVSELKKTNQKLDRLIQILESGKVKVVVGNAEELRAAPGAGVQANPAKPGAEEPKVIIRRKGE